MSPTVCQVISFSACTAPRYFGSILTSSAETNWPTYLTSWKILLWPQLNPGALQALEHMAQDYDMLFKKPEKAEDIIEISDAALIHERVEHLLHASLKGPVQWDGQELQQARVSLVVEAAGYEERVQIKAQVEKAQEMAILQNTTSSLRQMVHRMLAMQPKHTNQAHTSSSQDPK